MIVAILRRLALLPLVMWGVVTIAFLIVHAAPGSPAELLAGETATPQVVQATEHRLGLDRPLIIQYGSYLGRVVRGDLGTSLLSGQTVVHALSLSFPKTLELVVFALVISTCGGVLLGAIAAARAGGAVDKLVMATALVGLSLPGFVFGLILVLVFAVKLPWFPSLTVQNVGFLEGGWRSAILPAVALALGPLGSIARMTRSSVLEVLPEDYVRAARARGLREWIVYLRHVGKNAAMPVLTLVGLDIGYYLGGSVAIEVVFAWPGMGRLSVQAILNRDYPTVQGTIMLFALSYVVVNLLVDLTYGWLDPRHKLGT